MWVPVKAEQARDALAQEYLTRRNRLRQRFEDERLGKVTLLDEASKFFKPITSAVSKAHQQETAEVKKVTDALERLPAQIATEANFNPIAALFGEPEAAVASAPPALPAAAAKPTITVNPDHALNVELIKLHGFTPPSELDTSDPIAVRNAAEAVNVYNQYSLGPKKQKAKREGDARESARLDTAIKALAAYRERIRMLLEGHKISKQKATGNGLKMQGRQFGDLEIDPVLLKAGKLRAFDNGKIVLEAPADESLYNLLTKRFIQSNQYTPQAVKTFKELVELAGLPLHGGKSKKHKLIHADPAPAPAVLPQFYNDPDQLVERLHLLVASKQAGNTGLDNEISAILDELMRTGAIPKDLAVQLNRSLLMCI